ncbi:MAG: hypothetical protein QXI81_03185 [Nitrososphaerota archaeon]
MIIASLSIVAVAIAIMAIYSVAVNATPPFINGEGNQNGFPALSNGNSEIMPNGLPHKMMLGGGCFGFAEASEGFKDKALNIAKNDEDVQRLLNDGYSVIGIRPIVKAVVEEDGSITMKATGAIVMLRKDSASAIVKVDVENTKVTEIVTLTKTMITKP